MMKAPARYDYLEPPSTTDAWSPKISGWQRREQADDGSFTSHSARDSATASEPVSSDGIPLPDEGKVFLPDDGLRGKYFDFLSDRRHAMALELPGWLQGQSRSQ